ncbi:hypothetical protein HDV02_002683 [Globomyces sp. JEL0801]|nr:hypothetical protein HDV02_002683 [Globomyces sp. JEL0801]
MEFLQDIPKNDINDHELFQMPLATKNSLIDPVMLFTPWPADVVNITLTSQSLTEPEIPWIMLIPEEEPVEEEQPVEVKEEEATVEESTSEDYILTLANEFQEIYPQLGIVPEWNKAGCCALPQKKKFYLVPLAAVTLKETTPDHTLYSLLSQPRNTWLVIFPDKYDFTIQHHHKWILDESLLLKPEPVMNVEKPKRKSIDRTVQPPPNQQRRKSFSMISELSKRIASLENEIYVISDKLTACLTDGMSETDIIYQDYLADQEGKQRRLKTLREEKKKLKLSIRSQSETSQDPNQSPESYSPPKDPRKRSSSELDITLKRLATFQPEADEIL